MYDSWAIGTREACVKVRPGEGVIERGRARFASGGGAPNKDTPRPPPRESEKLGGGLDPPPGKVKNSGGVRAKKARCSLAMESTKKLAKILTGLFSSKTTQNLRRNYTSFELTLF